VETLVASGGKHQVTLPPALAPGDYLLRAEIIALHEADTDYTVNPARGAQFYPSCSQFKITGSGTVSPPGTFGFVGGYSHADPGILYNLYAGATSYSIPGPAVWDGKTGSSAPVPSAVSSTSPTATSASSAPASSSVSTPARTSSTVVPAAPSVTKPASGTSCTVPKYYQCGGKMYTGGTNCVAGTKCTFLNEYYSQCL